jgi:hypothetical protein
VTIPVLMASVLNVGATISAKMAATVSVQAVYNATNAYTAAAGQVRLA